LQLASEHLAKTNDSKSLSDNLLCATWADYKSTVRKHALYGSWAGRDSKYWP